MRNVVTIGLGLAGAASSACGASSPPSAPASIPATTTAPAATPGGTCEAKIAAARASGAAAPVTEDASVDPLCQWRIDDARNDVTVGAASATVTTAAGNASPGILQNTDGTPPEVVAAAFRTRAADIAACGRAVPDAPPILRVRIVAEATGTVTWAAADYRASLPDTARACVETALRGKPFLTHSPGRLTATYGYAFGASR